MKSNLCERKITMSRAYKIKVKESARHVLRASDCVSSQLELLEILPPERMADLLANELVRRGFQKDGDKLARRTKDGVVIEIDPVSATVTVKAEGTQAVTVEGERQALTAATGKQAKREEDKLRQALLQDLQRQAEQKKGDLQKNVTDQLEGHLTDLRKELDQAINRVTAEALKEKAAQIGQIKEMTEDAQTGSLTIVLEV
jgi:FtsH ternary system domain X5